MRNQKIKKSYFLIIIFFIVFVVLGIHSSQADGGLSISQTRIIFDAKAKNTKVSLINQSDRVYLVNSRVLKTADASVNTSETMPFILTPPLFRLEKEGRNTVLISKNNTSNLPTDRESVFYLSFLAIPSTNKINENESDTVEGLTSTQISFGIRTTIKLFYRPSKLSVPVEVAPQKLTFTQENNQLEVTNPTPYYMTLAYLTLDGKPVNVREQGSMVAPFSSTHYHIPKLPLVKNIQWSVVNDFGGVSPAFNLAL